MEGPVVENISLFQNASSYLTLNTILVSVIFFIILRYIVGSVSLKNYPPGPSGWPIVGYLPYANVDVHKQFMKLQKTYGKIFSLKFGGRRVVVLNDFKAIKESNYKDEFTGRRPNYFQFSENIDHVGALNGEPWKESRRFMLTTFRNLGLGKNRVEDFIQGQISIFLEDLDKHHGEDMEIDRPVQTAISNIIMFLTCGRASNEDTQKMLVLLENFTQAILKYISIQDMTFYFPVLGPFIKIFSSEAKRCRNVIDEMEQLLWKEIENRKKNFDDSILDDYMDYFISEMKKGKTNSSTFTDRQLNGNCQVLFLAASDTIKATIEWTILILAKFPEEQEKVYQQIVEVLGDNKSPSWEERHQLPYLQAFIMEVTRWKTFAPLSDTHWTLKDTTVQNYFIPKHTLVHNNIFAVHNDPDLFPEPEIFRPERFLSADGREAKSPEYLIPFNIGKRMCPGDRLASIQVFLFVASVLQRFKICPPSGGVNLNEKFLLVLYPESSNVRIERRYR